MLAAAVDGCNPVTCRELTFYELQLLIYWRCSCQLTIEQDCSCRELFFQTQKFSDPKLFWTSNYFRTQNIFQTPIFFQTQTFFSKQNLFILPVRFVNQLPRTVPLKIHIYIKQDVFRPSSVYISNTQALIKRGLQRGIMRDAGGDMKAAEGPQ